MANYKSNKKTQKKSRGGAKSKKSIKSIKSKNSFRNPLHEEIKNFISNKEKYIPSYDIINEPAFGSVIMNLNKGQNIVTQSGCMSYMDTHIDTKTTTQGGIFKGLKRALFTTSSMFMTEYIGTQQNKNKICFASFLPGTILPLRIRPSERIILSPFSLICFTRNLTITTKRRVRGLFTSEGIAQTEFVNETNHDGLIWIAAYGGYNKVTLQKDEQFKLDNGLFLCSQTRVKYKVGYVGGVKTGFLSGEGLVMNFTGPCDIYVQGRNIHKLTNFIRMHSQHKQQTNVLDFI